MVAGGRIRVDDDDDDDENQNVLSQEARPVRTLVGRVHLAVELIAQLLEELEVDLVVVGGDGEVVKRW